MSIKMQFSRPLHRLTCAIAAAWVACTLTESNVVVVISAAHASDGAQSAAAMAQVKRWRGRENCILMLT
ncbi:hypothetical protein [Xanthomonas perforans]|uniref:hypothetical protein n=1 Tax=Xanthomonas perforans TaxID=442694 RepID=UPI0013E8DBB3|nr:hypothetical protein [Xanthomonas perforans]